MLHSLVHSHVTSHFAQNKFAGSGYENKNSNLHSMQYIVIVGCG